VSECVCVCVCVPIAIAIVIIVILLSLCVSVLAVLQDDNIPVLRSGRRLSLAATDANLVAELACVDSESASANGYKDLLLGLTSAWYSVCV
jgi:hypothetical protein